MKISRTIELTQSKVGRNDPCPCGSGKKFKKCCLGKDISPLPPAPMQKIELIRPLTDWATSQEWYGELFKRIFHETLDRKPGEQMFEEEAQGLSEVILFEGKTKAGKTPLELFIETFPVGSSMSHLYTRWKNEQIFGIWQVLEVYLGTGMKIASSQNKQEYLVQERMGSFSIQPGNIIAARILPLEDHWIFGGGLMAILPKASEYFSYLYPKQLTITGKDFLKVWYGKKEVEKERETRSYEELKEKLFSLARNEELPLEIDDFDTHLKEARHPLAFFYPMLSAALENRNVSDILNQLILELWEVAHQVKEKKKSHLPAGPLEEILIQECMKDVGKSVEEEDITNPDLQIDRSKSFINNWLDRPRKKFGYKTPREIILEERGRGGNPETKIEFYSVLIYWSKRWDAAWELHEHGFITMRKNGFAKARDLFVKVLTLYPDFPQRFRTLANLGMCLVAIGDTEAGKQKLKEALQVNPNYRFARERLDALAKRTPKEIQEEIALRVLQKRFTNLFKKSQSRKRKTVRRWLPK